MLNGNGNGKKKKLITPVNIQTSGTLLGGRPGGSIVSPIISLTSKIGSFFGEKFGRPTAANRPGVKPVGGAVSAIKPVGIQPLGGRGPAGIGTIRKVVPKFDPVAHRAKTQRGYSGWRPTSFKSIMGGFSGISGGGSSNVTTGVIASSRFATFGRTGLKSLSQVSPGRHELATGWRKLAGFASIHQGDVKGYSTKFSGSINPQASLFKNIITSQKGTGYTGSKFLGTTGGHFSLHLGKKKLTDAASGKSLFIQHYNKPQFLHSTLSGISSAIKRDKLTYNISTSSGKKSVKMSRGAHALSTDYEIYKSYMNKFFSKGTSRGTYSTEKPTAYGQTWGARSSGWGAGMRPYSFGKIQKSYKARTSSGKIPTIGQYSMNLVGYDILKPQGK